MTSLHLNQLFKDPTSKYSHTEWYWGLKILTYIFGRDTVQLIVRTKFPQAWGSLF